ncbi:pH-gated potassium channel KcsA [Streptomyces kurssanovii]|nr:pH-gated potassium channel KcsA [Streptomyces kurssanovii]
MQQPFLALFLSRLTSNRWWRALHVRAVMCVSLGTAVVLLAGSALMVAAERGAPDATITSFPRAVWWSVETATTVGYGDLYPVTAWGRVIAAAVMLAGITTFGIVTAALATWFVGRAQKDARAVGSAAHRYAEHGEAAMHAEVRALHERFDRVEQLLADRDAR